MSRSPKDTKRAAIFAAATRTIAAQGLAAPTAAIAKEAGISNGSLFNYFSTKADLLNQLYIEIKMEMGSAAMLGLPIETDPRAQLLQLWRNWLRWAAAYPEKRRTLAHLTVSDDITPETRKAANQTLAATAALIERARQSGPMRDVPIAFVSAIMSSIADTTIDFMAADPANSDRHSKAAFEALWRILT
jgi:AcrR family transcriptional regulator